MGVEGIKMVEWYVMTISGGPFVVCLVSYVGPWVKDTKFIVMKT